MTPTVPSTRINHFSESTGSVQGHGVHTAFCDLAASHSRLGHEVGINQEWRDGVLHVHTLGPAGMRRLVRHRGLRVVSAHVTPGTLRGSLRGVRLYSAPFTAYLRTFYNQADLVIAVSAVAAAELRAIGVRTPIQVVPNAILAAPFRNSADRRALAREELRIPPDQFVVLGVGQLQPRKGVGDFVECARAVPQARFVWLGGSIFGALSAGRSEINRVIAGAPPGADFLGQQPREVVARWCRAADAFLFPSRHETFGMAPVEAAFAGLPLVLSDLPVFTEVFGADGYLGAHSVDGYAAHLRTLQSDPVARAAAGGRAAAAVERYDGDQVAARIAELYFWRFPADDTRSAAARRLISPTSALP